MRAVLDAELDELPEKWRLPLILCYLEGRTQDEAASQLAWSKSTLRRRLEEARDALGRRLSGRGVVWPAALSAVLLSECIASAAPGLVASTVEAAAGVAAGKTVATAASVKVAALAEGVLKAMLMTKLKTGAFVLLMLGMVGLTCGVLAFGMTSANGDDVEKPAAKANEKADTLTVTIKSQKNPVRVKEPFKVDLRVVNSSKATQSFRVMNGSWDEHWKSSNDRVSWERWPVSENSAVTVNLEPGEAYEKTLPMLLLTGKPQEKVSFKMGFTPIGSNQSFWSNEVTVQVEPEAEPKKDLQFHPSATATDLKIELMTAAKATRPHKAIYLTVKVTNRSSDEILTGIAREWGGGKGPAKLPFTLLHASIVPVKETKAPAFEPAYQAGDAAHDSILDPVILAAGKSADLLLRMDWPGAGFVPALQFPDEGGSYKVQVLLVFQKTGKTPQKMQYVMSEPTIVEVPGLKPVGAKPEPWTGAPVIEGDGLTGGKKLSTFKRLPKAADATVLRINCYGFKPVVDLTAANFPAVLDSMKAVSADDPKGKQEGGDTEKKRINLAHWSYAQFETSEGRFQVEFYLGGLALLTAPDGSVGWVTFDSPKLPLPGGNAPLPELVKGCKGALVATLQEVGAPEVGPPGAADYASKWKVERVLRGDYPKTTDLSFRVQSLPEKSREKPPAIGKTYILITHEANAGQIAAVLEADEKILRQVQDLLRR